MLKQGANVVKKTFYFSQALILTGEKIWINEEL